ncbi:MAG: RNA methyltransferase [Oscillospiraceae bacterium]|nr:RNA methyltransferase [Oscillospiraceae bacterium]
MEERISSRKNPLLQQVKKLLSSRAERRKTGLFVADGTKLLEEAVKYWPGLQTVILTDGVEIQVPDHVRVVRVPEDVMASISPMEAPQGALFLGRLPEQTEFVPKRGMLILDGVQDPGNIGTILRTADAMDVPVVLLEGCADPWSWKVIRSTMGAAFRTPVVQASWEEVLGKCREAGIPIGVTALSDRAVDIRSARLSDMALVIGSEGRGVRKEVLENADHELIIPMNPHCESLNAAIAAAIVMWEIRKN